MNDSVEYMDVYGCREESELYQRINISSTRQ